VIPQSLGQDNIKFGYRKVTVSFRGDVLVKRLP
jgi:hypothetical protein